jgi:large subunit ribosomal protein L29
MKIQEVRKLKPEEAEKKLSEMRLEMSKELGGSKMGRASKNPGKIGQIRLSIARILTVKNELRAKSKKEPTADADGKKAPAASKIASHKHASSNTAKHIKSQPNNRFKKGVKNKHG